MKDYSNLKNKTVFDFCNDETLLEEVLPPIPDGYDRDRYLKDYWDTNPHQLALAFVDLAELMGDKKLLQEAEKQFSKELNEYFNEL